MLNLYQSYCCSRIRAVRNGSGRVYFSISGTETSPYILIFKMNRKKLIFKVLNIDLFLYKIQIQMRPFIRLLAIYKYITIRFRL